MQLVAVLVVGVADGEARRVVDDDATVEGVELEEAILPLLLLLARVVGEEAAKLCDGRGVLGCGYGGQAGGASNGGCHGMDSGQRRVVDAAAGMERVWGEVWAGVTRGAEDVAVCSSRKHMTDRHRH